MGLGWGSLPKLIALMDALSILFFFNAGGIDSFWLSVMLILSALVVIAFLGSWRASKRVETGLTS